MKVLQIANDYRNNNLYDSLFTHISKNGVQQKVYVPFKQKLSLESNRDYEIIHEDCYTNLDRFFFYNKSRKIFRNLSEKVNISDIEIIHAHTLFSTGYLAYMLYEKYKIPYIISVRGTDIEVFLKKLKWLKNLGREILLNARRIIFISATIRKDILNLYSELENIVFEKSVVIPNAIDSYWLENIKTQSREIDNSRINLIQVGWINRNKNVLNTIKALEILLEEGINISLKVVGGVEYKKDKKYYDSIMKYISKRPELNSSIKFTGRLNKEELIKEYDIADIFVLPSYKETLGIVYLEALSQNLPIIYSENRGIDGLFSSEYDFGFAINPDSPKDIAKKINQVIMEKDKFKNLDRLVKDLNWRNISYEISSIYKKVIKG